MNGKITAVHVTHEAVDKIGGIGAVLEGFFTCNSYLNKIERSILVGPLFISEATASERLGKNGEVLYSSIDGFAKTGYANAFSKIEKYYNAGIVYGQKTFVDKNTGVKSAQEVLLVDVRNMHKRPINEFKKRLFEKFNIQSQLYENCWDYEQYVRLALPAIEALKAIDASTGSSVIMAHEFMGMPTALAAKLDEHSNFRTIFYAHETATMRRIIEEHPGHDTMFYNVMKEAKKKNLYVNDVFGDQGDYFKHPLVDASKHCDAICAVGDYTAEELRFLGADFENVDIDIVYNGIPAYEISYEDKMESKQKLQQYCENLLEYKPDFIFTHVTRLVQSKGLWRDLRALRYIEKEFRTQNKTGVMFLLSTEVAQRQSKDIFDMETKYGWPTAHREGWPDLSGGEAKFYTGIQKFNAKSKNIKIIFINQFGFEQKLCGKNMPTDMEFMDIRKGSDVEFGMSIYEPFGISQLETLTFGGICVPSTVCGCAGFVRDVSNDEKCVENIILADYVNLNCVESNDIKQLIEIDHSVRKKIEQDVSETIAMKICSRLPRNRKETEAMIQTGYELAKRMSWNVIVENYILKAVEKTMNKHNSKICVNI